MDERKVAETGVHSNPVVRLPELLSVFGMCFKIADAHRDRKLYCIITVDNCEGSEDIYHDFLPEAGGEGDDYLDLALSGPEMTIDVCEKVYFAVVIYDPNDPELWKPPPVHNCEARCEARRLSCHGSYPVSTRRGIFPTDLLVWVWNQGQSVHEFEFGKVYDVDLIQEEFTRVRRKEFVPYSYGSLLLEYAACTNAVIAKVKVELMASRLGGRVTITADCSYLFSGIILLHREKNNGNIILETETENQLLPLKLSRSKVTLSHSPFSVLTVQAILFDLSNPEIEIDNCVADFPTKTSGTEQQLICGGDIRVIVSWN